MKKKNEERNIVNKERIRSKQIKIVDFTSELLFQQLTVKKLLLKRITSTLFCNKSHDVYFFFFCFISKYTIYIIQNILNTTFFLHSYLYVTRFRCLQNSLIITFQLQHDSLLFFSSPSLPLPSSSLFNLKYRKIW